MSGPYPVHVFSPLSRDEKNPTRNTRGGFHAEHARGGFHHACADGAIAGSRIGAAGVAHPRLRHARHIIEDLSVDRIAGAERMKVGR